MMPRFDEPDLPRATLSRVVRHSFTRRTRGRLAVRAAGLALAFLGTWTSPGEAQFGLVESLFSRVTDISFYGARGDLAPRQEGLEAKGGLQGFGVELLFQVGAVTRPAEPESAAVRDTVVLTWRERRVTRSGARADTVDTYDVGAARKPPEEELWTFELAIGYGQISGFSLEASGLDLRGSVRELPAVTLYASHVGTGAYLGLRTGLIETHALRLYESDGSLMEGSAQAFQLGGVAGLAFEVMGVYPFVEGAWMARSFPSVAWDSDALPAGTPRALRVSGWNISAGLQVPLQ